MKIFFIASIHGKLKYGDSYEKIVSVTKNLGHSIFADHILGVSDQEMESWDDTKNLNYHKKVLDGIKNADVIISEISHPSTSVGYLLSVAVESGKPTVAFYSGKEEPHLLPTLESDEKFQAIRYTSLEELEKEISISLEYAADKHDTRFNFFISPSIGNYLDWVAKKKKLPRAVYLRRLIEEDMKQNKEYQG